MPDLLTPDEVLARYTAGPDTGIFTDGSCDPNPGPGGWGMVWVEAGEIRAEVIAYDEYIAAGGEAGAKSKGVMRLEGKEYVVQDGDVVHFRVGV